MRTATTGTIAFLMNSNVHLNSSKYTASIYFNLFSQMNDETSLRAVTLWIALFTRSLKVSAQ